MIQPNFLFLSVPEAAEALVLTEGRVRQLLVAGTIRGNKLGKKNWAIPAGEVERYKRERRPVGRPATRDCA